MGQIISLPFKLLKHTSTYYRGFWYYLVGQGRTGPYAETPSFLAAPSSTTTTTTKSGGVDDFTTSAQFRQHARIHLYSLASNFYLYNKPHYRKGSYRDDLVDNLRNVAIPGTGVPLSLIAASRWIALPSLLLYYPIVSLAAAVQQYVATRGKASISLEYARRLLAPNDWFSYWRLNCNIVALHSLLNDMPSDYNMENKWTFLQEGVARNVPVSPFMTKPEGMVVKHRNEEGGMGIHFFKNAACGGDWILQERIENSNWVATLLPPNAPLSTFRVITCSRAGFKNDDSSNNSNKPQVDDCKALSCVFRAGRAGAATDHDSILFDVDVQTGLIRGGTTNAHWYKLGPSAIFTCPWRSRDDEYRTHPDGNIAVSGNYVPDIKGMLHLAEQAHFDMCPLVPMAGWDVVLSADSKLPVCLLEVNLSCNFFR